MVDNKIMLPLIFGVLGFIFSLRPWILFMNTLSPLVGLIMYYVLLIIITVLLEHSGLTVAGINFNTFGQAIGTILIIFSFFIIIKWQSCYMDYAIHGRKCENIDNIFLHSEDGATYYLWSKMVKDPNTLRILTYIITPVLLSYIGMNLITEKVTLSPF